MNETDKYEKENTHITEIKNELQHKLSIQLLIIMFIIMD